MEVEPVTHDLMWCITDSCRAAQLSHDVCLFFRRSYGSVFKASHKETSQIVAIKQIPVESDLQEIIKEISIMQQCDRYGTLKRDNLN